MFLVSLIVHLPRSGWLGTATVGSMAVPSSRKRITDSQAAPRPLHDGSQRGPRTVPWATASPLYTCCTLSYSWPYPPYRPAVHPLYYAAVHQLLYYLPYTVPRLLPRNSSGHSGREWPERLPVRPYRSRHRQTETCCTLLVSRSIRTVWYILAKRVQTVPNRGLLTRDPWTAARCGPVRYRSYIDQSVHY